jgi:hypothetical protein
MIERMTTFERSQALWIGGGLAGALIGFLVSKHKFAPPDYARVFTSTALSAALGSILVGAVGDKVLEQHQRTGEWSLMPLRR